jgi:hypothetical protein
MNQHWRWQNVSKRIGIVHVCKPSIFNWTPNTLFNKISNYDDNCDDSYLTVNVESWTYIAVLVFRYAEAPSVYTTSRTIASDKFSPIRGEPWL